MEKLRVGSKKAYQRQFRKPNRRAAALRGINWKPKNAKWYRIPKQLTVGEWAEKTEIHKWWIPNEGKAEDTAGIQLQDYFSCMHTFYEKLSYASFWIDEDNVWPRSSERGNPYIYFNTEDTWDHMQLGSIQSEKPLIAMHPWINIPKYKLTFNLRANCHWSATDAKPYYIRCLVFNIFDVDKWDNDPRVGRYTANQAEVFYIAEILYILFKNQGVQSGYKKDWRKNLREKGIRLLYDKLWNLQPKYKIQEGYATVGTFESGGQTIKTHPELNLQKEFSLWVPAHRKFCPSGGWNELGSGGRDTLVLFLHDFRSDWKRDHTKMLVTPVLTIPDNMSAQMLEFINTGVAKLKGKTLWNTEPKELSELVTWEGAYSSGQWKLWLYYMPTWDETLPEQPHLGSYQAKIEQNKLCPIWSKGNDYWRNDWTPVEAQIYAAGDRASSDWQDLIDLIRDTDEIITSSINRSCLNYLYKIKPPENPESAISNSNWGEILAKIGNWIMYEISSAATDSIIKALKDAGVGYKWLYPIVTDVGKLEVNMKLQVNGYIHYPRVKDETHMKHYQNKVGLAWHRRRCRIQDRINLYYRATQQQIGWNLYNIAGSAKIIYNGEKESDRAEQTKYKRIGMKAAVVSSNANDEEEYEEVEQSDVLEEALTAEETEATATSADSDKSSDNLDTATDTETATDDTEDMGEESEELDEDEEALISSSLDSLDLLKSVFFAIAAVTSSTKNYYIYSNAGEYTLHYEESGDSLTVKNPLSYVSSYGYSSRTQNAKIPVSQTVFQQMNATLGNSLESDNLLGTNIGIKTGSSSSSFGQVGLFRLNGVKMSGGDEPYEFLVVYWRINNPPTEEGTYEIYDGTQNVVAYEWITEYEGGRLIDSLN